MSDIGMKNNHDTPIKKGDTPIKKCDTSNKKADTSINKCDALISKCDIKSVTKSEGGTECISSPSNKGEKPQHQDKQNVLSISQRGTPVNNAHSRNIISHHRSDANKRREVEQEEEDEEEILGSDDDEQEDPRDYVKGN